MWIQKSRKQFNFWLFIIAVFVAGKIFGKEVNLYQKPQQSIVQRIMVEHNDCFNWTDPYGSGNYIESIVWDLMNATNMPFPLFNNSSTSVLPNREFMSFAIGYLKGFHGVDTFLSTDFFPSYRPPNVSDINLPRLTYDWYLLYQGEWDYAKQELKDNIRYLFENYANLTNYKLDEDNLMNVINEIVKFEWSIANNISMDTDDQMHLVTLDDLQQKYPAFNYKIYFSQATPILFKKIAESFDQYNIVSPKGLKQFNENIYKFLGTFSPSFFGNYLYYRLLDSNCSVE